MALSGLDIYKVLPKTNCKQCGFPTCLAFAMQLAKKAVSVDKCPTVSPETKSMLEAASLPPVRQVTIGAGADAVTIGNETCLFRHEEKFRNPCAIGFIIDDNEPQSGIERKMRSIASMRYERVGQAIVVNAVAVRQTGDAKTFVSAVKSVSGATTLGIVLISQDSAAVKEALAVLQGRNPLVYGITAATAASMAPVVKAAGVPVVAIASNLDEAAALTQALQKEGIQDIVLDTGRKPAKEKIWDLTQVRRLALKKSVRALGYPVITSIDDPDPMAELMEASTYVLKYGGIVLLKSVELWQAYALLTLRQSIYTDPQKPLQVEPKLYEIGKAGPDSPVLVTTNFSLSYFTVLGEVEASKVPAYILSVDTEGMSVLTAWAAEKFNPEKITGALRKYDVRAKAVRSKLIIPGYVAMMSGDMEEQSGWEIVVGPKEASGIPAFLKNYA